MGAVRYVLLILLVGALALCTVAEHVERTRLGYELRGLMERRDRLREEEEARRLAVERALVPERLVERGVALGLAPEVELRALVGAQR